MVEIRSKLNQILLINLKSGKSIDLLAGGTAAVSEDDFSSSHLQNLLAKGKIIVVSHKPEPVKPIKKGGHEPTETETDVSGTEGETTTTEVVEPEVKVEAEEPPVSEPSESEPEEEHEPESRKTYGKKKK